jgi:hypothetical protein
MGRGGKRWMMGDVDTFNRWLIGSACGGRFVKVLAPPTAYDELTPDQAMLMAAYLLVAAGCDRERFRVVLDAVLDT